MSTTGTLEPPHSAHVVPIGAIRTALRDGHFAANDTYDTGSGNFWVKASAVWISKKRFYMNHGIAALVAAATTDPSLEVYACRDGTTFLRLVQE